MPYLRAMSMVETLATSLSVFLYILEHLRDYQLKFLEVLKKFLVDCVSELRRLNIDRIWEQIPGKSLT